MFIRLILFIDNIYNVDWTFQSLFYVSSLFNTIKITWFFFPFCLSLVFHGRGIPCQSPTVVGEHSTVPLPLISLLYWRNVLMETFSMFITHCTIFLWEKIQMRVKEVYFSAMLQPNLVALQKAVYTLLIVLSPSVSQKSFYYKFKTVPSRLFFSLKELVEEFVRDKVSYLWTNENTFFQFCLT